VKRRITVDDVFPENQDLKVLERYKNKQSTESMQQSLSDDEVDDLKLKV
jgi:hypothetical protein